MAVGDRRDARDVLMVLLLVLTGALALVSAVMMSTAAQSYLRLQLG